MTGIAGRIAARARRFGPLPWSVFMEAALYDPDDGFYTSGGAAGRSGDFLTSPEIGPLFAAVVARALDGWWDALGRPDPFLVIEAAAGVGTLARDVLAARPRCEHALRYILVERSARLRHQQSGRLSLELPAFVLGPSAPAGGGDDGDDDGARAVPGRGPMVTGLGELPAGSFRGVVFANELIDNMPVDLLEWREGRWHEVRVGAADDTGDGLVEVLVVAAREVAAEADRLAGAGALVDGARIPLQRSAVAWLRQALALLEAGWVVVVDYAATTEALAHAPAESWLRTFRQHQPGAPPITASGRDDITCVVATDQLAAVAAPSRELSQAEWLAEHGIEELVEAARAKWRERAAVGDLEALRARSRVDEARALCAPDGLGAFRVIEWRVP